MGEILSKLREEFLEKSRPTARMTPLPNSRVPASFHHQMELFLALNFNKYLCDIHSACQALFRHFTNTGLFKTVVFKINLFGLLKRKDNYVI